MPRVTLAQMDAQVLHRIEENSLFYSQSERYNAINENLRILQCYTGWYQQTVPMPTLSIAGRTIYDIPASIIVPLNVRFDLRSLEKSSLDSSAYSSRDVLTKANSAPRYWIPMGLRKFIMSPGDSIGGRFMEVTGIAEVPQLVNSTDAFTLSDEFADLVEDGSYLSLVLKEGGKVLADAMRDVLPGWKSKLRELSRWETMKNPNLVKEMVSTR